MVARIMASLVFEHSRLCTTGLSPAFCRLLESILELKTVQCIRTLTHLGAVEIYLLTLDRARIMSWKCFKIIVFVQRTIFQVVQAIYS